MLNIFLEEQSETFIRRFKKVIQELEGSIAELDVSIEETNHKIDMFKQNLVDLQDDICADIQEIIGDVIDLTNKTAYELDTIFESIKNTENIADETLNTSIATFENVERKISEMENDIQETKLVTNAILQHLGIEHPYITRSKEYIAGLVKGCYKSYKELIIKRLTNPTKQEVIDEFQNDMIEMFKSTSKYKENFIIENVKSTVKKMNFSDLDQI